MEYRTREEGEIRVLSNNEKQPTHHRKSATHESTYQGVKQGTYQENGSCAKDVAMKKGVEKVKAEYWRKMEYLEMLYTRIFQPLLPGFTGLPVSAS